MTQKRLFGISGAIATAALIGGLLAGCMVNFQNWRID